MISTIILAAGQSLRFGSPKGLVHLPQDDTNILLRLQTVFWQAQVEDIIVVLGAQAERLKPFLLKHKSVKCVYNKHYKFGQTSSFQQGLRACHPQTQAVCLCPVDYPWIKTTTVTKICHAWKSEPGKIIIPVFQGRKGHPPLFPITYKKEFLGLSQNLGCREISRNHPEAVRLLPVQDRGVVTTFNTREELLQASESLRP